jgi:hypothetical protein
MVELIVARIASFVASKVRSREDWMVCPLGRFRLREMRGEAERLSVGHQCNSAADQGSGYGDAVRPGHRRLHRVRDCRRGVTLMYAQAFRLGVS